MRRLGLVVAALPSSRPFLGWASTVALIVRTIDFNLYERFTSRIADDKEVIESIFSRSDLASIRDQSEGIFFEAIVIMSHKELRNEFSDFYAKTYKAWTEIDSANVDFGTEKNKRAIAIVRIVRHLGDRSLIGDAINFPIALERVELFSADLTQKDTLQS